MNKAVLALVSALPFITGWYYHSESYGRLSGVYYSDTESHVATKSQTEDLMLRLRTELELNSNSMYELNLYTRKKSGSFTKGVYVYDNYRLSLYEQEHVSFQPSDRDIPFSEKVVIGPGTMGRENMTVVPIERANNGFILFTERAAYLYHKVD
ncbi:hypothetical protein [Vibrio coralliilyticus]|uniref:hypothetical protein n=1 Tax=Vibrio coralliilyticus TaxID=190893 RepID=UPI002409BB3C|nr:hypothetical protein [Vibrio coralliilyticus]WFB50336.1 hypothetical protein P6988_17655 [Vibrio coralliilyticus]